MTFNDFISSVGYTLQDSPHTRWTIDELVMYMNDGLKDYAVRTLAFNANDVFTMDGVTTVFPFTNEVIKISSVVSSNNSNNITYTINDPFNLTVISPNLGDVITVNYFTIPQTVTNITTTLNFFHNVLESLRYYVLSRCYQKDETTENFNKSALFEQRYLASVALNADAYGSDLPVTKYQSDFYSIGAYTWPTPLQS